MKTYVTTAARDAMNAQRVEDCILGVQQCEVFTTWTLLDGIALYLSNIADKRADNPEIEDALNLAAAHAIAASEQMKQGL